MRYRETGEVHRDFHLGTNNMIRFILGRYGMDFLKELMRRTAQDVYRDIHEHLKAGDWSELLAHWKYFHEREGGESCYACTETKDALVFHVLECPAAKHLAQRGVEVTEEFRLPDILLNEAWSEGTPLLITTEVLGPAEYRQTVTRRNAP